jgi:hypothetical protein
VRPKFDNVIIVDLHEDRLGHRDDLDDPQPAHADDRHVGVIREPDADRVARSTSQPASTAS